jgi:NADPH-dependent ferric siderophore reductase
MTSVIPRAVAVSPILAFDIEVAAVTRLSPHFVRVTFGGADLAELDDGGDLGPRDLRVKLMFASPGHPLPDFGDLARGWYPQWLAMDPATRGSMRTYTIRAARVRGPQPPQVDIDFVLHPGTGPAGPAARWIGAAQAGDRLVMLGPNRAAASDGPPPGVEWRPPPTGGARVLLVGDETAVPAIGSILATLPPDVRGHVLVEVPDAADVQDLRAGGGIEVRWCARGERPRGERLAALVRATVEACVVATVAAEPPEDVDVDADAEILWETADSAAGDWYAWLAGEAATVRGLRRYLVGERGIDRRQVAFMGYWREGRAES